MDIREKFVTDILHRKDARALELGPLNRPILKKEEYPNCRYCDIRSTEAVKALYSGNAYLEATGVWVDTNTIVEIDDVIHGTYTDHYANEEKFDAVIASHVLEHMEDLIFALRDISGILKPGGLFCIIYPDKRYCFDHFRQSASFRDAYTTFFSGTHQNTAMVLDFFLSAVAENSAFRYWHNDGMNSLLPKDHGERAFRQYEAALKGARMDDVHYWPFTDLDFLMFLYDGIRTGLLPFRCVNFIPTPELDQQFMVALRYDPCVPENPEEAMSGLAQWMTQAHPSFYTLQDRRLRDMAEQQSSELERQKNLLSVREAECASLQSLLAAHQEKLNQQTLELDTVRLSLAAAEGALTERAIWLKQQDGQIHTSLEMTNQLQQQLAQRDAQLAEQNRVSECQYRQIQALQSIENSTIWRTTAPLRWLLDILKGNKRGSN